MVFHRLKLNILLVLPITATTTATKPPRITRENSFRFTRTLNAKFMTDDFSNFIKYYRGITACSLTIKYDNIFLRELSRRTKIKTLSPRSIKCPKSFTRDDENLPTSVYKQTIRKYHIIRFNYTTTIRNSVHTYINLYILLKFANEIKNKTGAKFRGVFRPGKPYKSANFVIRNDNLFHVFSQARTHKN